MNVHDWDIASLDAEAAEHHSATDRDAERAALLAEISHPRPSRVRMPAPREPRPEAVTDYRSLGWVRELRACVKEGLLTKNEARAWMNLPARRWWQR